MARQQTVTGSRPLAASLAKTREFGYWKNVAYMAAGAATMALGLVGLNAVGFGLSYGIDMARSGDIAKDQKKILANHYREQIAAQLGINPQDVTYRELERAAQVNPAFAELVRKVNVEEERSKRTAAMGTAAAFAAGGAIPILGTATGEAAKFAVHLGGNIAGGMASSLFNKDKLETEDLVAHIDAKIQEGMQIDAMDVMLLRIAQDPETESMIKKQFGKGLHKMNEAEQRGVLAALPDLYATAERDAQAVNSGRIKQQDLLVTSPGQSQQAFGQFTARHQSRARSGSWTQQVNTQRANAPAGGMVRS